MLVKMAPTCSGGLRFENLRCCPQMQGCTVLADYHEKGPARQAKQGSAARVVQQGRSRAYTAVSAASMASSTESSWLPVVHARSLQGNPTATHAVADSATDVADDDLF